MRTSEGRLPNANRAASIDAARRLKGETVKLTIPTSRRSMFAGFFRRAA